MASNIPLKGNPGRAFGIRQFAQFLFAMGNRIYLNATQQLLINAGGGAVMVAVSYLILFLSPAPVDVDTANNTHAGLLFLLVLLLLLLLTGVALVHFTDVVRAFPRVARVASRVAHKINHIFLGGPA